MKSTIATVFLVWAAAVTAGWGQAPGPEGEAEAPVEAGTLRLRVVNSYGDGLFVGTHFYVRVISVERNTVVGEGWNKKVFEKLPFGYYLIWAQAGGRRARRCLIALNTPERTVRIGLPVQWEDEYAYPGDYLTIRGRIHAPGRRMTDVWVKVHGVFLNEWREAQVDHEGKFEVSGLDMGVYVVEVFHGTRLLHAETVEIDIDQAVTTLSIVLDHARRAP